LRGHRDQITAIHFIQVASSSLPSTSTTTAPSFLLTSAKDTFIKLWDLSTQHCVQTVVAHRAEVWTLAVDAEQKLVFSGSAEGEMKAWQLDHDAMSTGLQESDNGEVWFPAAIFWGMLTSV
jgi:U3 small nucleolar RNA-associated protein 12